MYEPDKTRKISADFAACLFIILAVFAYFYKIVFFKNNFFIGDIYTQFFPWKNFLRQSIENRAMPFWNPFVFSGMPFLADMQKGAFYPPGIVFYFLGFSPALKIYVLAHFLIMGLSVYMLLRAFNFSPLPSIAGSFVFLFNSFTITKVDFLSALGSIAFLPLIMLVFKKFLSSKKIVHWALFICLLSLSFLSGHPPVFIYTLLLLAAFYFYHLVSAKEFRFSWPYIAKTLLFLIISSIVFSLLVLPQLGLFLELMKNSSRMAGLDYRAVSANSVSFENLLAFLMPAGIKGIDMNYLNDWFAYAMGTMNFFTITALFLVTASFFYQKTRLYVWSALVLCVGLLMSMGKNTPVYSWFFTFIPFFSAMRHPAFAMTLIILPFAVITAFSMENISSINDAQLSLFDKLTPFSRVSGYFSLKFSSRIFKVFLFLVFIFALVILNRLQIMKVYNMDSAVLLKFIYGCLVFLLIFGFNIVLFFFREKGSITTNFYSIVLVFFMFFESFYFMSGINPVVESKIYDTASLSIPAVPMIKSNNYKIMHTDAADRDRVIPGSSVFDSDRNFLMQIPSNTGMLFDISEAGGYDALELKDYHDFMSGIFKGDEILSPEKLNLLNVKYLVTLADMRMEDLDKLYDGPYFKIYKNHSALPMFFASKSKDTLDLLISQSSWSRKLYDFSLCRVSATIDEDGYFIFSNNFYPGWKVYVDNKTAELEKCFGIYMGVKLTKGTHDLIFKYHPNNMGLYMFLFYVIVLAFLVSGVVYLFYRK